MKLSSMLLSTVCLALASACGSSHLGSCSTALSSQGCVDYEEFPGGASAVEKACTQQGLTYSKDECTADGRVGRCRVSLEVQGYEAQSVTNYYGPATKESARASCEALSDFQLEGANFSVEFIP